MRVLPNRQRAIVSGRIGYIMHDLLQRLDVDYYRAALLLVARTELERLRQGRSASADVERGGKSGASTAAEGAASPNATSAGPTYNGVREVRSE